MTSLDPSSQTSTVLHPFVSRWSDVTLEIESDLAPAKAGFDTARVAKDSNLSG